MPDADWEIPVQLQPDPDECGFDLDRVLSSVVGLRSTVPPDAFTAGALGTEREGSGVVIREDGLVLTMGYLTVEAETVWIVAGRGAMQGHPLAYDHETGFGLVQPLGRAPAPPLPLGSAAALKLGDPVILAAAGGRRHAIDTRVIGRQEFAGYWEYLLEDALFTAPAHPFWGGSALIGADGRLLGIGSLIVQRGDAKGRRLDSNMVVPVDRLAPVLDELATYGQLRRPARPWLGLYAAETDDAVVVGELATGGPAEQAGVQIGDRILALEGEEVADLGFLWRRLWAAGPAGARVTLNLARDGGEVEITVVSADRARFLKTPRFH